jgi:hypothetical protein
MLRSTLSLAALFTLAACSADPSNGDTGTVADDKVPDNGDFQVSYEPSANADLQAWEDYYQGLGFLETIADSINGTFALPRDAALIMGECGFSNAFWTPKEKTLALCLELSNDIATTFANSNLGLTQDQVLAATVNTYLWVSYHEMGHALIDLLDLPTTGKEEDAVDQFSTVLFIEGGAGWAAVDAGVFFYLVDQGVTDPTQLADEHALNLQRFYNVLCLVYGSDPNEYADLLTSFPEMEARAPRCKGEYKDASKAWTTLLEPYAL